ncbi:MAG TPA: alanine racemase [Candidatus Hydrogenedentes bacterium]|nr:alanine racemase [Candidatus Hydrogenedentota bacterium]
MNAWKSPSRALIDLNAYRHNLRLARRLAGGSAGIIAVIKANAYGHGLIPLGKVAATEGCLLLGVASLDEAAALRAAGISAPILLMVSPHMDQLDQAVELDLRIGLSDLDMAVRLGEIAERLDKVVRVHVKVDTGMGRQGFHDSEAVEAMRRISRIARLDIEGIATHFPSADNPDEPETRAQIKRFRQLLRDAAQAGIPFTCAHAANSAGLVHYADSVFDAVRPGLLTYGIWPGPPAPNAGLLERVLRWETRVIQVRELPGGASIGYGRTYRTQDPARIAVIPVGYADGYPHALSNRGYVLIRGKRCPVRGSVCMDQTMVEVTHLPEVRQGDPVTLIGVDGPDQITAEELARWAGTIPYVILTGIGSRVERVYIGEP